MLRFDLKPMIATKFKIFKKGLDLQFAKCYIEAGKTIYVILHLPQVYSLVDLQWIYYTVFFGISTKLENEMKMFVAAHNRTTTIIGSQEWKVFAP